MTRQPAANQPASPAKIPVSLTGQAIRLPFHQIGAFAKFSIIPILITLAAQYWAASRFSRLPDLQWFLLWAPYALAAIPFCVAWTRLAVDGALALRGRGAFSFGPTELRYLGMSVLLPVIFFGPSAVCLVGAYLLGWVGLLLVGLVLLLTGISLGLRFTFVLPAIAVERYPGFRASWGQTKGCVSRLAWILFVVSLPYCVGDLVIEGLSMLNPANPAMYVSMSFLSAVLLLLSNAWIVGAISLAYKFRSE